MELKTIKKTKVDLKKPKLYNVIFHNDDYTTMEYVVYVLNIVFGKTAEESTTLMMKVHNEGLATVGTYTFDIASTKKYQADALSNKNSQPLKITIMEVE